MILVYQCDVSVGELTVDKEIKEDSKDGREKNEHDDKLAITEAGFAATVAKRLLLFHFLSVHEKILQFGRRGSFLLVFGKVVIIIMPHIVVMMIMRIVMIVTRILPHSLNFSLICICINDSY